MACPKCHSTNVSEVSSWTQSPEERTITMASMRAFPPKTLLGVALKAAMPVAKGLLTKHFKCGNCHHHFRNW
ncbi:MAG UNVERIFIED_CONTAM: hypothetical protein LVR18_26600 [Planctomycetaceae bacterium]|jgi:hypothetical protein